MFPSKPRSHRHGVRRRTGAVLGLAAIVVGATALPAFALDGPVANDDYVIDNTRTGTITQNVLRNDTWDRAHTARVSDVRVVSAQRSQFPRARVSDDGIDLAPAVSFTPGGDVTVKFGGYDFASAPSVIREARVIYTLTDTAGQTAEGAAFFTEQHPQETGLVTRNDTNSSLSASDYGFAPDGSPRRMGNTGDPVEITPVFNDSLGRWDDYRIEPVTQPAFGSVTVPSYGGGQTLWFTPAREAYTARTESFSYRLCSRYNTNICTAPATVTLNTVKPERTVTPVYDLNDSHWFWVGGTTSYTFDPLDAVRADGRVGDTSGLTVVDTSNSFNYGSLARNADGTWTYMSTGFPPANPASSVTRETSARFDIVNSTGNRVATVTNQLTYRRATGPDLTAANLGDDEVWVKVGQRTSFLPFENDTVPGVINSSDQPVGAPVSYTPWPVATTVQNTRLGTLGSTRTDLNPPSYAPFMSPGYIAGNVAGTDTWVYRVCAVYPTSAGCDDATVTIHVSPQAQARADRVAGQAGVPAVVPVLDNDDHTDRPTQTTTVTVTETPDGVTAIANPDRTITVTTDPAYNGGDPVVGYRLTDFTGTSEATVTVALADNPVEPPVDLVAPDAVDDNVSVAAGDTTVTVPVLANDTFAGTPTVTNIDDNPAVTVNGDNTITITAEGGFQAGEAVYAAYGLEDGSGSDVAGVRVTVTDTPVVEPPVVEPPVVEPPLITDPPLVTEPPVVEALPEAADDTARVVAGRSVTVPVLVNDTFVGTPTATAIGTDADGVTASVNADGDLVVATTSGVAAGPVEVGYVLRDRTGTDTGTVVVTVTSPRVDDPRDPPVINAGGDHSPGAAAPAAALTGVVGGLGLPIGVCGLLLALGALMVRRTRSV